MELKKFTVRIRRTVGWEVKPEAEQIDNQTFDFAFGWVMDKDDPYPGEIALIPRDVNYPVNAPAWLASGDLVEFKDD